MSSNNANYIDIVQLRIGLYIHLDLGWMDHPFTLSNFKVKDQEQINKIRKVGLKKLRYDPTRSDCEPLPIPLGNELNPSATGSNRPDELTNANEDNVLDEESPDLENMESILSNEVENFQDNRLQKLNKAIDESEKKFLLASEVARESTKNILLSPESSILKAETMVKDLVNSILTEGDIIVHALNGNRSTDQNYTHALNVTMLCLMMAKSLDMTEEDAALLGMAALFHDIGKIEIPDMILMKKEPLTKSEQAYLEQHSEIGAKIAKKVGLPDRLARIILQHHENSDGTGYPARKKSDQTDPLARLVALINTYDNLCNPSNPNLSKTPYEALAYIFANQRSRFDESFLKRLIKSLGVYPPGSIVQLSNGNYGVVVSVNPNKPLRPFVMVYDPLKDRREPLIIDLREEPNINISICMKASQLPPDVQDYLNPRKRISYFIDKELAIA